MTLRALVVGKLLLLFVLFVTTLGVELGDAFSLEIGEPLRQILAQKFGVISFGGQS